MQRNGAGIAIVQRGQVLLIRRRDNGLRDLPGGGVKAGESVLNAAQREWKEETGLEVIDVTLLDVFSGPAHQHIYPDGNAVEWVTALYVTRDFTGMLRAGDDAARWWPLAGRPTGVSSAIRSCCAALRAHLEATP